MSQCLAEQMGIQTGVLVRLNPYGENWKNYARRLGEKTNTQTPLRVMRHNYDLNTVHVRHPETGTPVGLPVTMVVKIKD